MQRAYADTSLGQVHYRELGEGDPVILLHQTAQSSDMWLEVMPCLAERFRVIAPDTPGFGDSDQPADPPGAEGYARSVAEFLTSLGIDRAHIVGHHTGAAIAAEFAATYPVRVNRLVLSGLPDYDADVRPQKIANIAHVTIDTEGSHLRAAWARNAPNYEGWGTLDMIHRAVVDTLKAGPNYYYAYLAVFNQDVRTRIPNITAPTLLMTGDQDMFAARQPHLAPLFANAKEATIIGSGALSMQQKPAEFCRIVSEFLAG